MWSVHSFPKAIYAFLPLNHFSLYSSLVIFSRLLFAYPMSSFMAQLKSYHLCKIFLHHPSLKWAPLSFCSIYCLYYLFSTYNLLPFYETSFSFTFSFLLPLPPPSWVLSLYYSLKVEGSFSRWSVQSYLLSASSTRWRTLKPLIC